MPRNKHAILAITFALFGCTENSPPEGAGIEGVGYIGLTVSNIASSTAFYAAPSLEPVDDVAAAGDAITSAIEPTLEGPVDSLLLRSVNAQLRVMSFPSHREETETLNAVPVNGPGIAHVCYQVKKETQTYEKMLDNGAEPLGDPEMVQLSDRNPVTYAYALDLDGVMIEVEHVDVSELDIVPRNDARIRQVAIATPNIDAAVAFYQSLLGGQEVRRAGRLIPLSGDKVDRVSGFADSKVEMAWFQTRNLELELIQFHSHPTALPASPRSLTAPGYSMIVFDVSDLAQAERGLLEAGGELVAGPLAADGGEVIFGRDVDGNLLGFQRLPDSAAASSSQFADNGAG